MSNASRLCCTLFFTLLLGVGIWTFQDYGVSADEATQRAIGQTSLNYVNQVLPLPFLDRPPAIEGPPEALFDAQRDRAYGVAFELPAEYLIQVFGLSDAQAFNFRHLLNFLIFYLAVYFFYRLLFLRYQNQLISLLGATLLVLSPRIYGDAFFNDKDLVFLSLFLIATYTLVRWLMHPTYKSLMAHALTCALAIDVRMMAIILPALSFVLIPFWQKGQGQSVKNILGQMAFYGILLGLLVIAFWPWLWQHPLAHFQTAFWRMARFENIMEMRFLGDIVSSGKLPWYYILVWLGVTTPLLYSLLFFIGLGAIANQTRHAGWRSLHQPGPFQDLIFCILFFAPLGAVIILHSVLYNGWRQMYFIYPAFILIAVRGLVALWQFHAQRKLFKPLLIFVVTLSLSYTAWWMVRYHPYQYLYFNVFAGESSKRFDVDYWGVAYREPILAILNQDPSKKYAIYDAYSDGPIFDAPKSSHWGYWQLPHGINILNLPLSDRARIISGRTEACSDYVLTTLPGNRQQYLLNKPEFSLFHELKVGGQIIYTTFKRNVILFDYYQPALGKVIDFANRNTQCFLRSGWGQNENWGVWSLAKDIQLVLLMPSERPKTLTLDMRAFINEKHKAQTINVSMNGVFQRQFVLKQFDNNRIQLMIPASAYGQQWLEIGFALPQAVSPKELSMGEDTRQLGIGLKNALFE